MGRGRGEGKEHTQSSPAPPFVPLDTRICKIIFYLELNLFTCLSFFFFFTCVTYMCVSVFVCVSVLIGYVCVCKCGSLTIVPKETK
jgi:hypothetical protein